LHYVCLNIFLNLFFLFQVKFSVYKQYAKAIGIPFSLAIIGLYGIYQALSISASIWLAQWTADPALQDTEELPVDSDARRARNDYFLSIYGEFGVAQGFYIIYFIKYFVVVPCIHHPYSELIDRPLSVSPFVIKRFYRA